MIDYLKKNPYLTGLAAIIILLVIVKIPHLFLPYYWDEAWVYGTAIRLMEEKGLSNKDVVSYFGSKSLVSQVLSKQRNLSLKMIKALHIGLRLPYEVLLSE